jgi:hypothetical protein
MANSAGNDIPNSLEAGGEISPEDAERFAAAFRPSWELDDAPFTQAPAVAKEDLLSLSADANTLVDAARPDEPFGPAPSTSQPAANPLVNTQPLAAKPPQKPPPPKPVQAVSAPTGYDGVAPLYIKPPRKGGQSGATSTRDDLEVPIKKSNKGIVFAVIGVVVLAGVGFALRVALSGDDAKPTPPTQTQTTSPAQQDTSRAVPPPPPPTEATSTPAAPTAKSTAAAPTTTTPPKDTATSAVAAANTHATPPTPPAPPPKPVAAAPQPKPQPQPPSQPKTPPKPAGGGIVRDNPF